MTYAVLHCSSDHNYFWHGDVAEVIPYDDLERTLPVFLANQMKNNSFSHLLVINGPGGFSQLRIACLCVNLLKMHYPSLVIASRNKVDLCHMFYHHGIMPQYQLMFIGMKKKLWHVNMKNNDIQERTLSVGKSVVGEQVTGEYCVDMIDDHLLFEYHPKLKNKMITYATIGDGLSLKYDGKEKTVERQSLFIEEKIMKYLSPDYMIAPKIG